MNNDIPFIEIATCEFCNKEFKFPVLGNIPKMDNKISCYVCIIFRDNPNGVKLVKHE